MADKHPGGRPTKYSQAMVEKAQHYLDNFAEYGDLVPQIAKLSLILGITRPTIYDWMGHTDKREFSYVVGEIMAAQEVSLMNGGLGGAFNASITKLALTKHGYHDKQDIEASGSFNVTIGGKDAEGL